MTERTSTRSRREFLAAAAAAPIVPALLADEGQASLLATSPESGPPTVFYARQERNENGELFISRIDGTAEALRHELDREPASIVERPFFPLASAKRFSFARTTLSSRQIKAWRDAGQPWPEPVSLLDVRDDLDGAWEYYDGDDMLRTRADALEFVAGLNRELIEEGPRLIDWYVVVEVGEPCECALVHGVLQPNGVGYMERLPQWPVRVVTPTDEERAAYLAFA